MKKLSAFVVVLLFVLAGAETSALSVPTFFVVQDDAKFTQTGPSTVVADGLTFVGSATPNDGIGPIDFDGGTISFPAASPLAPAALSPNSPNLQYSSGTVSPSVFHADYPTGIYTFHLTDSTNPSNTQTESVDSSIATMPSTVPMLTAASFNALQGMDPTKAQTVNFNSFADAGAPSLIFFALVDSSNDVLLEDGLQPGVTQDVIPANMLSPGSQYDVILFFTNTVITADNNGEVLMDNRTDTFFTTQSVPEPASGMLCLITTAAAFTRRRRSA